jgi:Protein of unknown function (DUF2568)
MRLSELRPVSLVLAFVLELVLLYALADWGFNASAGSGLQIVLGVGLPLLLLAIWSRWLAPRAPRRLPTSTRVAVKAVLFLLGSIALYDAGHHAFAVVFEFVSFLSVALEARWEQRD